MRSNRYWSSLAAALLVATAAGCWWDDPVKPPDDEPADAVVVDFEGLANEEVVTDQFAGQGIIFDRALAADTSPGGLNQNFVEPRSGGVMAINCVNFICGALTLSFPNGAISAGAYVTGFEPVTLTCFDGAGAELGSTATPGRNTKNNPDGYELHILLEISASGISSCSLVSQDSTNSFAVDDVTFTPAN